MTKKFSPPRLVAWEVTRACNLACRHCRAEAQNEAAWGELSSEEGLSLIEELAEFAPGLILILTGGEPLLRKDIFELASYGVQKGLRVVMSPNGTLLNPENVQKMKEAGISRVSVSLDGSTPESHDDFRGVPGAFEALKRGVSFLREAGLPFQINTTITPNNMPEIEEIQNLAQTWGAIGHHVFLLVPTGRGANLAKGAAQDYEETLKALLKRAPQVPLEFKATCAPQYNRLCKQQQATCGGPHAGGHLGRGCLGGQGFVFVSHDGLVSPCGYLPLTCGKIREQKFSEIYRDSSIFLALRDKEQYHGKCGHCEFWAVCGGCRARAHVQGDYLGEDPLCPYQPRKLSSPQ